MPGKFSTSEFDSFIPQIEFINKEFEKRSIIIHPLSRYAKYLNCLRALAKASATNNDYNSIIKSIGMPLIVQSLLEGAEIYGVLKQFESENDKRYESYLKMILSGCDIPNKSEAKTQSRDIMFELNLAAHFKKAKIACELAEPDLKVEHGGYSLFIACKRPQGISNLESIIRKARRQISTRGDGLIALSLDKIINPQADVLRGIAMDNLATSVRKEIDRFRESNGKNISQWADDRKVLGIIYSLCLMGSIESPNLFVSCQQMYVGLYCPENSPYYKLVQSISNNLVPLDH